MRKFIIKYFALSYIVKIGKRNVKFPRAINIILPLMSLNSMLTIYSRDSYIDGNPFTGIILLAILFSLYFWLVYFHKHPVFWNELDKSQKWQYGKFYFMFGMDRVEWEEIDKNNDMYSPFWVLLVNPLTIIMLIILYSIS